MKASMETPNIILAKICFPHDQKKKNKPVHSCHFSSTFIVPEAAGNAIRQEKKRHPDFKGGNKIICLQETLKNPMKSYKD